MSYQHGPKQDDLHERTSLIVRKNSTGDDEDFPSQSHLKQKSPKAMPTGLLLAAAMAIIVGALVFVGTDLMSSLSSPSSTSAAASSPLEKESLDIFDYIQRLGTSKAKQAKYHSNKWYKKRYKDKYIRNKHDQTFLSSFGPPAAKPRCEVVIDLFLQRDEGTPPDDLKKRYLAQYVDPNVFYRATAHIFWHDFTPSSSWMPGNFTKNFLLHNDPDSIDDGESVSLEERFKMNPDSLENIQKLNGVPMVPKNVWTWVTGDQHLSNFGAWRNRHGDVVYGVNDFDEAGIYDFQIDVLRIAVSIRSHALTNEPSEEEIEEALKVFTNTYVQTVLNYKDNENALLFELTHKTTTGELRDFLYHTQRKKSKEKLMTKFCTRDAVTGQRHFIKGDVGVPHNDTRLATVPDDMAREIKQAFNESHYGATMMKMGWAVLPWDDAYFAILDVAERIGSGIGSYGVDRYYVLLKGRDELLLDDGEDGSAVILDVKYQPTSAVTRVLNKEDAAWYKVMFPNEAARVVEAQRRLTSYTDPFTGWVTLRNLDPKDDTYGQDRAFSVRQRSPWKDSIDIDHLTDPADFNDYVRQIAAATATSHVRGSVAKAPADFKHVIYTCLGGSSHKRREWGKVVAKVAKAYREQVLLDFECFRDYVQEKYGSTPADTDTATDTDKDEDEVEQKPKKNKDGETKQKPTKNTAGETKKKPKKNTKKET